MKKTRRGNFETYLNSHGSWFRIAIVLVPICVILAAENVQVRAQVKPESKTVSEKTSKQIIELSEDKTHSKQIDGAQIVQTKPLSKDRLKQLAAMLLALPDAGGKPAKFEPPSYTRRPPPPVKVVNLEFPPKSSSSAPKPDKVAMRPLKIVRISHKGAVDSFDTLTVTFNQPMIFISSTEASDQLVPVKLTPQPKGSWHWIAADTISFQPAAMHFPQATTYKVEVPAGITATSGAKLSSSYKTTVETPAPRIDTLMFEHARYGTVARSPQPVLAFSFNQAVEADQALSRIHASAGGSPCQLRLATTTEVKADVYAPYLEDGPQKKWLFVRPSKPFPRNSKINLVVDKGVVSKEGPNRSKEVQSYSLETYKPFAIQRSREPVEKVSASPEIVVRFNNYLAADSLDGSMIKVDPPVANLHISAGNDLALKGKFKTLTNYTVTISNSIRDVYGQRLIGKNTMVYRMIPSVPCLFGVDAFGQIVPSKHPIYKILTMNVPAIKVSFYEARVSDWQKFLAERDRHGRSGKFTLAGISDLKLLSSKWIKTNSHAEEWKENNIELAPQLKSGASH